MSMFQRKTAVAPSTPEVAQDTREYATTSQTPTRSENLPKKMEKSYKKIVIIFIVGGIIATLGLITGILWPYIHDWAVTKMFVLSPDSLSFDMWKETPIPMYFKFYMYNWTNPHDFYTSKDIKPNFVEMGPYVFREIDYKVNKVWNDNGTVTFQRKKVWHFDQSLSNGSLSDKITNLNPIVATVGYSIKNKSPFVRDFVNRIMLSIDEKLILTKSVRALLFDGYNDTLLYIAKKLNATTIPYTSFGWFYARNGSETYDGTFDMLTGSTNLYNRGILKKWNYSNRTDNYKDSCGVIDGTLGDLWPPLLDNTTLSIFINDICTSLMLTYENKTDYSGITGRKYIGNDEMLDNGTHVPSRKCYCPDEGCEATGTLNIASCKFGAPAYVSMPHFYLADPSYGNAITGVKPDKDKHELSLIIEPNTGIPLQVNAKLQLNLLVEPVENMSIFQNINRTFIPMLWFHQEANLSDNYVSLVKIALILPTLGYVTFYGIAGIGFLIIFIGIFMFVRQRWQGEENQVLLSKQENDTTSRVDAW